MRSKISTDRDKFYGGTETADGVKATVLCIGDGNAVLGTLNFIVTMKVIG